MYSRTARRVQCTAQQASAHWLFRAVTARLFRVLYIVQYCYSTLRYSVTSSSGTQRTVSSVNTFTEVRCRESRALQLCGWAIHRVAGRYDLSHPYSLKCSSHFRHSSTLANRTKRTRNSQFNESMNKPICVKYSTRTLRLFNVNDYSWTTLSSLRLSAFTPVFLWAIYEQIEISIYSCEHYTVLCRNCSRNTLKIQNIPKSRQILTALRLMTRLMQK